MTTEQVAEAGRRRDRRRDSTVQEIVDAADQLIAGTSSGALSFREVARRVGMSVQSLYHYFESRDHLISVLTASAITDLVYTVESARGRDSVDDASCGLLAAGRAYREWAICYPARFELIFGTSGPRHLEHGSAEPAMRRLAAAFFVEDGSPAAFDVWVRIHGWVALEHAGHLGTSCWRNDQQFDAALHRILTTMPIARTGGC